MNGQHWLEVGNPVNQGTVYLVGAGPGDPDLITRRGLEVVQAADVVVYDRLVSSDLLLEARPDARLLSAGKCVHARDMDQDEINEILAAEASAGRSVSRLKGGDPFIFGRGGEEADFLRERGIPFEVVPGVTSALAGPAYAGIPVTDRRFASSLAIVTGHPAAGGRSPSINWQSLASSADTLVVLMGMGNLEEITEALLRGGRGPETPAAVVQWAATGRQASLISDLQHIAEEARGRGLAAPAVVVVGEVAALGRSLGWFERRPLHGLRVAVTRPRDRTAGFARLLRRAGADPVVCPLLRVELLPADEPRLRSLLGERWDWALFTSPSGVECFGRQLRSIGLDWRALAGVRLGAVGPGTANSLQQQGLIVEFVPARALTAALGEELPSVESGARILLPRAAGAGPSLVRALRSRGAQVEVVPVYRAVPDEAGGAAFSAAVGQAEVDVITFASASAVERAVELVGPEVLNRFTIACIGPVAGRAALERAVRVDIVAEEHTAPGLVAALEAWAAERAPVVSGRAGQ